MDTQPLNEIAKALCEAQGELGPVTKNGKNPAFMRDGKPLRYMTLADVWDSVRPVIAKHGLSIVQLPCTGERGISLTTTILHTSGQSISSTFTMPLDKPNAHGVGSALTYARRYALCAMLGIVADDDDDGNQASLPQKPTGRQQPTKPATLPPADPAKAKVPAAVIGELSKRWAKELNGGTTSKDGFIAFALHHLAPAETVDLTKPSSWDMEAVQIVSDAITHSSQAEAA